MTRFLSVLTLILFGMIIAVAGTSAQKPTTTQKTSQPKFKAIWEPVNYKEDLPLFDVFFVSKEEGWVSGGAGTIRIAVDKALRELP
jgi:photosystem II stability/assembly factor-like uncharacterized protein